MLKIRFKGKEYLFTSASLEQSGAIATPENYAAGRCSYAHWFPLYGCVMRFNRVIGTRKDIEVIGPAETPEVEPGSLDNILTDPSWFDPTKE